MQSFTSIDSANASSSHRDDLISELSSLSSYLEIEYISQVYGHTNITEHEFAQKSIGVAFSLIIQSHKTFYYYGIQFYVE